MTRSQIEYVLTQAVNMAAEVLMLAVNFKLREIILIQA